MGMGMVGGIPYADLPSKRVRNCGMVEIMEDSPI